jgi:hypothetical protein
MMRHPPDWATEIVRNHFCLHRANIMKQCREWATRNKAVEQLLPQLQELLDQQTLADGSRPVLPVTANGSPAAAAVATPAAAAPAKKKQKKTAAEEDGEE